MIPLALAGVRSLASRTVLRGALMAARIGHGEEPQPLPMPLPMQAWRPMPEVVRYQAPGAPLAAPDAVLIETPEKSRSIYLRALEDYTEAQLRHLEQTMDWAARRAIFTSRSHSPVATGRFKTLWRRADIGQQKRPGWRIYNNDHPGKGNWLEGRHNMLARGRAAAQQLILSRGFRGDGLPVPVAFRARW